MKGRYYIYMLECSNGHYYTGIALDPAARYRQHRSGKGAYYTRVYPPRRIVQCWSIGGGRGDAMKVEAFIKSLPRKVKEELAETPGLLSKRIRRHRPLGPGVRAVPAVKLQKFNDWGKAESPAELQGRSGPRKRLIAAGNDDERP